ncbi:MAG: hypothetical protein PUB44_02735 [Clostridium sp.]|nr:hypothetical protein [Clostridium sp.]
MKKKKTKLFSWTVASVAALTLLCGTWASAAVSLTSGADGIYLRNSGKEYTFQVDAPKNHFVAIRVDGVYLMGEKAPVQIDIEVGGTAPVVTPAPETQAPSSTKTPTTEAPTYEPSEAPAPSEAPTYEPSEAPAPSEAPTYEPSEAPAPSEAPVQPSGLSVSTGSKCAVSELPSQSNAIEALVKLAAPAEANAETYYATIGLPASYLDTLSDGSHTVVMDFVEGSVSTTITVTSDASMLTNGNPSTGDTTHVLPYVLLAAGSACVLVFLAKKEKKETK